MYMIIIKINCCGHPQTSSDAMRFECLDILRCYAGERVKLAWKTATLLALVTAKCCSDLTLLCVNNWHLFLQCHAAIFVPLSGDNTDRPGHLPPHICIESHSNVNLCPVFYLKAYFRHTESFRKKSDGS